MAADQGPVKYHRKPTTELPDAESPGIGEAEFEQPGTTASELIAKVGNLKFPGDGFADDLESVQAKQGLADTTEWPD